MLFDFDITVPAHTPLATPTEQIMRLTRGTLTEIRVMFPPGPATLVSVTVSDRLIQLVPANPDGYLNFDEAVVSSKLEYDLLDEPYELLARGWSPNANYSHTITIQCNVQPIQGESWGDLMQHLMSYQGSA